MSAGRQLEHAEARPVRRTFPIHLLAHDLERPDNVGSLFRLADALGVAQLHLTGATPRPPHPRIRKLARSTERAVPFAHADSPDATLEALSAQGFHIAALEWTTESSDVAGLADLACPGLCLVLGTERHGVAPALLARCDAAFHVPMYGQNSSMNVAMAAAIAVHAAARAFRASPETPTEGKTEGPGSD